MKVHPLYYMKIIYKPIFFSSKIQKKEIGLANSVFHPSGRRVLIGIKFTFATERRIRCALFCAFIRLCFTFFAANLLRTF